MSIIDQLARGPTLFPRWLRVASNVAAPILLLGFIYTQIAGSMADHRTLGLMFIIALGLLGIVQLGYRVGFSPRTDI
ncbi:hypothetical protein [uncultured Sphingomonas sp.]|uniref:hypothetical protein n=1 Tax=uncultured Sphingomonas sp. TaxID=158754 RepID=UPI0035CBBB6C